MISGSPAKRWGLDGYMFGCAATESRACCNVRFWHALPNLIVAASAALPPGGWLHAVICHSFLPSRSDSDPAKTRCAFFAVAPPFTSTIHNKVAPAGMESG